jgi:NitT/TauT family transport system substrate-binding protein
MTRRLLLLIALVLFAGPWARAAEIPAVTMAVPAISLSFSMGYLAQDTGLFAKEGIAVKEVDIAGLGAINSLIAGSSDFAEASGASLTRAAARGQRLLAIAEFLDRSFAQIAMRKSVADAAGFDPTKPLAERAKALSGRTIAVDSINSVNHAYLRLVAHAAGLDPESVRIGVISAPSMLAAMAAKQVDGLVMTPPWPEQVMEAGDVVMIASGPDGDPADLVPFANSVLLTRPEVCEKRPGICEKMGHAFAAAARVIRDDPDAALKALAKRFPALDEKTMAASFALVRKITPVPPAPTLDAIRNNETYNVEAGLLKPEEQLKSFDGLFTDKYVR